MKALAWDPEKNEWLKANRGVSFEQVALRVDSGDILDLVHHYSKDKYAHQRIYVVEIDGYAYLVPFVESETEIFFKTIIPSRQATKKYLRGRGTRHGQTH
ncbi:MAG: BrnT family toxin [Elusimicrobia bacterium]|nr:BrnT family toxin [Elusimicrobiota bacterium]